MEVKRKMQTKFVGRSFNFVKKLVLMDLVLVLGFTILLFASGPRLLENLSTKELSKLIEQPFPGFIAGEGTEFEITESDHLKVSLASSKAVQVLLESIPGMVNFGLQSKSGAVSTTLTLSGFEANKTYYRYQNGELVGEFTPR